MILLDRACLDPPEISGGALVITALGLGVAEGHFENLLYIPLAFGCWMSPVIGVFYGYMGWFSPRASEVEKQRRQAAGEAVQTFDHDDSLASLKPSPATLWRRTPRMAGAPSA